MIPCHHVAYFSLLRRTNQLRSTKSLPSRSPLDRCLHRHASAPTFKAWCAALQTRSTPKTPTPDCTSQTLYHPLQSLLVILVQEPLDSCHHLVKRRKTSPPNPGHEGRPKPQTFDAWTWRLRCCIVNPMMFSRLWGLDIPTSMSEPSSSTLNCRPVG